MLRNYNPVGRYFLLLLFIYITNISKAQFVHYKAFTLENGLPSTDIRHLHQDRAGYLWIATRAGLVRYNSYDFQYITTRDGLPNNQVERIYEDQRQRLWILTEQGGVSYWQHNRLHRHPLTDTLGSLLQYRALQSFDVDAGDTIWFSVRNQPPYPFDGNTYFMTPDSQLHSAHTSETAYLYAISKSILQHNAPFVAGLAMQRMVSPFQIYTQNNAIQLNTNNCKCVYQKLKRKYLCLNERFYAEFDEQGIVHAQDSFASPLPAIASVSLDLQNNLWVATQRGTYIFAQSRIQQPPTVYFPQFQVRHILQDREGSFWLATQQDGLIFLPYLYINVHTVSPYPHQNHIRKLLYIEPFIHALSTTGMIYKLSENTVLPTFYNQQASPADAWIYLPHRNQLLLSNATTVEASTGNVLLEWWNLAANLPTINTFEVENPTTLIIGSQSGIISMDLQTRQVRWASSNDGFNDPVTDIQAMGDNHFWLATPSGMYAYNAQTQQIQPLQNEHEAFGQRVQSIEKLPNERLAFITYDNGIYLKNTNDKWIELHEADGLSSEVVYKLAVQNDSVWWVGTNRGLDKLQWTKGSDKPIIINYGVSNGLPSNGIYDILPDYTGRIWLATDAGVVSFNPNQLARQTDTPPPVYITRIAINGRDTTLHDFYELDYSQQNWQIEFLGIRFRDAGNVMYRYRLEGKDADWLVTNQRSIQYTNLASGEYTFWVSARDKDGVWNPQAASIRIFIRPPFWWTWWFWAAVGGTCFIILIIYLNILKRRAQLQRKVWASEQNALRAQMNPHFIFNAMNSILYFVRLNDKRQATSFLASFSILIRRILDNSKHPLISLHDEVETLQRYLELEKLRLNNPTDDFRIEVAADIDPQTWKLPPMLIQPLIENSIVHGLSPKTEGVRTLLVTIQLDKKQLRICVEDNGIGRAAAAEIQKRRSVTHTSYGSRNIDERLRLLNQIYKRPIQLKIEDLQNADGSAAGTRMTVWIPVLDS